MKYYNLNIKIPNKQKDGHSLAIKFLKERKAAPIFFGETTPDQLIAGDVRYNSKAVNEAKEFISLNSKSSQARLVTIDSGFIWIYRIIGQLEFGIEWSFEIEAKPQNEKVIPKYYRIEMIKEIPITAETPYILAAMKSSQAFARGTFTEINKNGRKYDGNIAALRCILNETANMACIDPLRCLSSVELETLVAKIFEAQNAFVPAYRGGVLKDVDVLVDLDGASPSIKHEFGGIEGSNIEIQVKVDISDTSDVASLREFLEDKSHVLITAESKPHKKLEQFYEQGNYKTSSWLHEQVEKFSSVRTWLERSLKWLPKHLWKPPETVTRGF